jgi:hypothetical protein
MTPQGEPAKQKLPVPIVIVIVLAVGFGLCSCLGILAAIAIPNFIKFQSRSKQTECKSRLKAAYNSERSMFSERDVYSENPQELGLADDSTRSVLVFGPSAPPFGKGPNPEGLAAAAASHAHGRLGVQGQCPGDCSVTIACAANVDNDEEIDVWSISTVERVGSGGQHIAAGVPYNDFNDLTDREGD